VHYRDINGISVSVVGMGCNQLGVTCDPDGAATLVSEAMDARINYFDRLEALESYAADRGHSLVELAFGWLLTFPAVATIIAGVARPGNADSASWFLTPVEVDEVVARAER
jgi:aryl-alcohol dehydrogenase-like predicted oxidoreductase